MDKGDPIRSLDFTIDEKPLLNTLPLITAKPLIFACNIDADSYSKHGNELTKQFVDHVNLKYPKTPIVILSSLLENELV